jgi:hypothetical protein
MHAIPSAAEVHSSGDLPERPGGGPAECRRSTGAAMRRLRPARPGGAAWVEQPRTNQGALALPALRHYATGAPGHARGVHGAAFSRMSDAPAMPRSTLSPS